MTAHLGPILLDTGALVHLTRDDAVGKRIASEHKLRDRTDKPLVCIITVGELLTMARRNAWGQAKVDQMMALLRETIVVDLRAQPILDKYAELQVFLGKGKVIQQNDVWIAATAAATGALILTTDKDFDRLYPKYIQRAWYDPKGR
ncbi:MAG: PIN domain-containing protein [Acidobacteria bacterium]|nr:PIN domain-containing protein [Acidobacteriota bacterium]